MAAFLRLEMNPGATLKYRESESEVSVGLFYPPCFSSRRGNLISHEFPEGKTVAITILFMLQFVY